MGKEGGEIKGAGRWVGVGRERGRGEEGKSTPPQRVCTDGQVLAGQTKDVMQSRLPATLDETDVHSSDVWADLPTIGGPYLKGPVPGLIAFKTP